MTDRQLRRLGQHFVRNLEAAAQEAERETVLKFLNGQCALIASGALELEADGTAAGGCGDGNTRRRERARVATAGDPEDADDPKVAARRRVAESRRQIRQARQRRDGSPGDRGSAGTPPIVTADPDDSE